MILLITLSLLTQPADSLTLQRAHREALAAWPLRQQISTLASIESLRTANLSTRYLPTIQVGAQALYHSDVAEIQLPAASGAIASPSNDQYKVLLGVDQLVYDGGVTSQLKALEKLRRDLETGRVEVELYKLREQVNTAYFGALVFESRLSTLHTLHDDLRSKLDLVASQIRNGMLLGSSADVLRAELIDIDQQIAAVRSDRRNALDVLGELIGRSVRDDDVLIIPSLKIPARHQRARLRPEFHVFDVSRSVLAGEEILVSRRNRPRISAFAETAFGRPPGLDFFETDFKPFYTAGLKMTWSAWTWGKSGREARELHFRRDLIDAQERAFERQITLAGFRYLNDIRKLKDQIRSDDELIRLRQNIVTEAESRLRNGTITATDYVTEKSSESRARLRRRIHSIQLARAKAEYLTVIGQQ